jgi:hypothetical protein
MPKNDLLEQIALVVKREMRSYRESTDYLVLEIFVGCILAELKRLNIIAQWEEDVLRQKLMEK